MDVWCIWYFHEEGVYIIVFGFVTPCYTWWLVICMSEKYTASILYHENEVCSPLMLGEKLFTPQTIKFWNGSCVRTKQNIIAVDAKALHHSKFEPNDYFLQFVAYLLYGMPPKKTPLETLNLMFPVSPSCWQHGV